jgi:monomeric type NADP-dependent isocitrate dehydrogenase
VSFRARATTCRTTPRPRPDDAERDAAARYAKVLGSAVNPVLREGNSDRRCPPSVKSFSKKNPHRLGKWSTESRSEVAHMQSGDFFGSERSVTVGQATKVRYEHHAADGAVTVLKKGVNVTAGEILDSSVMNVAALRAFYAAEIADAKEKGLLLSLHLKATMMKVSDPVLFGHAVTVFFADVFEKHAATFAELGVNPNNGLGDLISRLGQLAPGETRRDRGRPPRRLRRPPGFGDGRLRQRHHQPACAQRRDHRRLDARRRPRLGQDVGPRRQAARHEGARARPLLRRDLPGRV